MASFLLFTTLTDRASISAILAEMTVEEKLYLLTGSSVSAAAEMKDMTFLHLCYWTVARRCEVARFLITCFLEQLIPLTG